MEEPNDHKKNYLEEASRQLRRIHFSIVAVATALLISISAGNVRPLDQAIVEVDALLKAQGNWNNRWMQDAAAEYIAKQAKSNKYWPVGIPKSFSITFHSPIVSEENKVNIDKVTITHRGPSWTLFGNEANTFIGDNRLHPIIPFSVLTLKEPKNLNDFASIWNSTTNRSAIVGLALPKQTIPIEVSIYSPRPPSVAGAINKPKVMRKIVKGEMSQAVTKAMPSAKHSVPFAIVALADERLKTTFSDHFSSPVILRGTNLKPGSELVNHYLVINLDAYGNRDLKANSSIPHVMVKLAIPLHEYIVSFPAKAYLQQLIEISTVTGEFDEAFPDLASLSKRLFDLPLDSLRNYLLNQRKQAKQNVQIMGLTFPASALGSWGIFVLTIFQIYFVISLRSYLSASFNFYWSFPWIGFHTDAASHFSFVLSGFVFPFLCSFVIALSSIDVDGELYSSILVIFLSSVSFSASIGGFLASKRLQRSKLI